MDRIDSQELRRRITALMPRLRQDLEDLVRIQSVSADPGRSDEVQRSADAVAGLFKRRGLRRCDRRG